MKKIKFEPDERKSIIGDIQTYFETELDQYIGDIAAEMLVLFFVEHVGGYYYNRGLHDAQAALTKTVDNFADTIYAMEQPIKRHR